MSTCPLVESTPGKKELDENEILLGERVVLALISDHTFGGQYICALTTFYFFGIVREAKIAKHKCYRCYSN